MLECAGQRIYTGITPDIASRFAAHCAGRGGAFTRSFRPSRVLASRRCGSRSAALKAEAALKKLPRPGKLRWVRRYRWTDPQPWRGRRPAIPSPIIEAS